MTALATYLIGSMLGLSPLCCSLYSKLLKERHHRGSDGTALANFPLFQEFFVRRLGVNNLFIIRKTVKQM
jgi:hypothetical protein